MKPVYHGRIQGYGIAPYALFEDISQDKKKLILKVYDKLHNIILNSYKKGLAKKVKYSIYWTKDDLTKNPEWTEYTEPVILLRGDICYTKIVYEKPEQIPFIVPWLEVSFDYLKVVFPDVEGTVH